MEGFIKLHRTLLEWEWYSDNIVKSVFIHLLLNANHKDNNWRGINIKEGQLITGRLKLASELNFTEMQIRTALKKLKSTNEITIKASKQYSIITINNWNLYQQNNQQNNQQITNEQPTNNQRITINKNEKNDKNEKNNIIGENKKQKIFIIPSIEEIKNYCIERKNNVNAEQFYNYYSAKGWMIGKNKMKDWKAAIRTWEQREKEKITNPINTVKGYNFGF